MFLCILKVIMLIIFVYGVYSVIILAFDISDGRRYNRCVFIDADSVSNVEDAIYTVFLRHPDTEIYIVYGRDTDSKTSDIIAMLCKKYDFVYSIEDK